VIPWSWPPAALATLALAAVLYAYGVTRVWRVAGTGRGVSRREVAYYAAGLVALFLALCSPLDALGEQLFSAHMVQHLVLMLVAAPLLVFGAPQVAYAWAAPRRWRRLVRVPAVGPVGVVVVNIVAMWFWHLAGPYQAALSNEAVHATEHATFLAASALLWWGVRRWNGPTAAIVLTLTLMQSGALGALLQFASTPWYPAHAAGAVAWGLTPLEDQQLAGLIMSVPAGVVYVGAAIAALYLWLAKTDGLDNHLGRDGFGSTRPTARARDRSGRLGPANPGW
jgi:putative membrane protein